MKVVLKLDVHDDKAKQKAMKIVSTLAGVESIAIDMKDKKLTVIGAVDPVVIASKLRRICNTEILSVGPAKEQKKDEGKKDEGQKDDKKKENEQIEQLLKLYKSYPYYFPQYDPYMPHRVVYEEDRPNLCVIC